MKCLFLQYRLGLIGSHRFVFEDGGGEKPSELVKAIGAKEKEILDKANEGKKDDKDKKKDIVDEKAVGEKLRAAREKVEKSALAPEYKGKVKNVLDTLEKKRVDDVGKLKVTEEAGLKKLVDDIAKELVDFEKLEGVKEFMVFAERKDGVKSALTIKVFGRGSGHWKIVNENLTKAGITDGQLRAVQKLIGVDEDGKAGPATMNALNKMLGLGLSEVTWGADTVMRDDKIIKNPKRNVAVKEKSQGKAAKGGEKTVAKPGDAPKGAPTGAPGEKPANAPGGAAKPAEAPASAPTAPGGPASSPDDGVPKEKTLGEGATDMPAPMPGGSAEAATPQPDARPNVQFQREREQRFAGLYSTPEAQRTLESMSREEKIAALKGIQEASQDTTPKLSDSQRFRLQQVDMIQTALASIKDNIDKSRTKTEWMQQALTERQSTTDARSSTIEDLTRSLSQVSAQIVKNPDMSLSSAMPKNVKDVFSGKPGMLRIFEEAKTQQEIQQCYVFLIQYLRKEKDYERARDLVEDTLLGPYFEKGRAIIPEGERKKIEEASAKRITASVGASDFIHRCMNPSFLDYDYTTGTKRKGMSLEQAQAAQSALIKDLTDHDVTRTLNRKIAAMNNGRPFPSLEGGEKEIQEQYREMMGTGDLKMSDEQFDRLIDEIAINAPLILISGGAASLVRSGLSAGARALIASGRLAKIGLTMAEGGGAVLRIGKVGKSLYWGGRAVAMGAEGAAFEVTHTALQGENLFNLPDWKQRIATSSLTLGAFHASSRLVGPVTKFLNAHATKFSSAVMNRAADYAREKLAVGSTEVATMVAVGLAQHILENGNAKDYHFVDELFHALISVTALKISGKVVEFGGKKIMELKGSREVAKGGSPEGAPRELAKGDDVAVKNGDSFENGWKILNTDGADRFVVGRVNAEGKIVESKTVGKGELTETQAAAKADKARVAASVEAERASRTYVVGDTVSVLTPQPSGKGKGTLKPAGGWEITGIKERDNGVKIYTVEKTDGRGKTTTRDVPEDFLLRKSQDTSAKIETIEPDGTKADDGINRVGVDRVGENMPEVGTDAAKGDSPAAIEAAAKSLDAALNDAAADIKDPAVRSRARAAIDGIKTFIARPTRATWEAAVGLWKGFINLPGRGFAGARGLGRALGSFFMSPVKLLRERAARAKEVAKAENAAAEAAKLKPEAPKDKAKKPEKVPEEKKPAAKEKAPERSTQDTPEVRARRVNAEGKEYSEVRRESPVVAIPDVHGDIRALHQSLEAQGVVDKNGKWVGGNRVVQMLGDYIDRGSSNFETLDYLVRLQNEARQQGGRLDLLAGNHEGIMLEAVVADLGPIRASSTPETTSQGKTIRNWLINGGERVLVEVARRDGHFPEDFLNALDNISKAPNHDAASYETNIVLRNHFASLERALTLLRPDITSPTGRYRDFFSSMKLMSQVDDVLYVHGGISPEWADAIAQHGVDDINLGYQNAVRDALNGNTGPFRRFTRYDNGDLKKDSPQWIRFNSGVSNMSDSQVKKVSQSLHSRGINAIVVGHDVSANVSVANNFAAYGIKVIAADVGMSEGYKGGVGGVHVDTAGTIRGTNVGGDVNVLHDGTVADRAAAGAAKGVRGIESARTPEERARENLKTWESKPVKDTLYISSGLNAVEYADKPGQWFIFHETECALGHAASVLFDFPSGGKGRVIVTDQPAVFTGTRAEMRDLRSEQLPFFKAEGRFQKGRLIMDMEMKKAA